MTSIPASSLWFSPVAQWCLTLCDPMRCSMPGLPAAAAAGAKSLQLCPILCTGECTGVGPGLPNHHQHPEITQTHVQCGEGNGTPLQYSCRENPTDREAWWAAVHGVAKSWTQLGNFTFIFHFHALEKEMATHYSILAWKIPWMEEPGRLQSVGLQRVGHD